MKKSSLHRNTNAGGITLRCSQGITAFAPDGSEIVSRYWGKRKRGVSQHKLLVSELISANRHNRACTREHFLDILRKHTRSKTSRAWSKERLDERLSTLLSQVKRSFAPYDLFEKTEDGYRLHASVNTEIVAPQTAPILSRDTFEDHFAFSF